uniref:F-box domain-containing protein n=1 Tax=Tanacetum cinerariifolium TaxID=118510 RepID=A0A699HRL3_TANCI|nr:F-box domain-containing protein [Tanacetum cinerariifolium]
MIVSVPTPYSARLLGFNSDGELIIEVDDIGYQMDTTLQVYHQTHEEFQNLGVEANSGSFFVGAFCESLILSNETDRSYYPAVAKIPEVMMQAKVFDQKEIDHTRYTISFTNDVNVPKQSGVFGDCGPLTRPSYYAGTFGSTLNLRKTKFLNCKLLDKKIRTLEAKIKILEGTLEMERNLENHTLESVAILHELYNDMEKLGLEYLLI